MKSIQVEVKDIRVGDRIICEDGNVTKVTSIVKGMPRNTIEFSWKDGFSAVQPSTLVEKCV